MMQVDGKLTSPIFDNYDDGNPATPPTPVGTATMDVWQKSGTAFVGVGGGIMYAIAPSHGPMLELKGALMFPETAQVLSAQLGYEVGF
jgi:hypothetical protein